MIKYFLQDNSIKNQHAKNIYKLIKDYGPVSKSFIKERLKIKKTTLARNIDELEKNKLISVYGHGEPEGGRPPVLYHIVPEAGYIVAIHIVRAQTKVVLFDLTFNQVEHESFVMSSQHTPEMVIPKVIGIIKRFLHDFQINLDKLLGIGIGTIGPLNETEGIILQPDAFFAPGWENVPIVQLLKDEFPVKIVLGNASSTALLGEYKYSPPPVNNILYIFNNWGLGCGVMINGELSSKIGETGGIGHMIIEKDGLACSCGRKGCLSKYTSLSTVLDSINKSSPLFQSVNLEKVSTQEIVQVLKDNYHLTSETVLKSAEYLGLGISNLVNFLGTEAVYVSGSLVYNYPNYYETMIKSTFDHLYPGRKVIFSQGSLKEEALDIGSASLVLESYF